MFDKLICIIILITGMSLGVSAQILKVDRADITADSSYWSGSVDFKLNVNNQSATPEENVTYVGTTLGADLSYISQKHIFMWINQFKYFSTGVGPFVSTGYAHFRANWSRAKPVSYENFLQVQYDRGRNMEWRGLAGAGVRLKLYHAEKSYIHVGLGGMFEQERWKNFEGVIIEKNIWKATSYVGADMKIGNTAELTTTFYYQGGYDTDDDVFRNRVSGDFGLEFTISKVLSFVTQFGLQYEDRPIIEINNVVYSLTNGVRLNF